MATYTAKDTSQTAQNQNKTQQGKSGTEDCNARTWTSATTLFDTMHHDGY